MCRAQFCESLSKSLPFTLGQLCRLAVQSVLVILPIAISPEPGMKQPFC